MPHFRLFSLDLKAALDAEIRTAFAELEPCSLNSAALERLQCYETEGGDADSGNAQKGLYILHYQEQVVYVGKADESLYKRLRQHYLKIGGRVGIDVTELQFRCLYLDKNWSALAQEASLIQAERDAGGAQWNNSGFGLHDPGRNRDKTAVKHGHFDRLFPVDPEFQPGLLDGEFFLVEILEAAKKALPYLLRYDKGLKGGGGAGDHGRLKVAASDTLKTILGKVVDHLGPSWQVTFLFGYVVVYEEDIEYGPQCCLCWKQGGKEWEDARTVLP